MTGRFLSLAVASLLGAAAAVAPAAEKPEDVVKRAVETYRLKNGLKKDEIKPVKLPLLPDREAFRYKLPAIPEGEKGGPLRERYAVLFVDSVYGGVVELKVTGDESHKQTVRTILAAMTLAGRKVTNGTEAREVFSNLFALDGWLLGHKMGDYEPPTKAQLREGCGPYRDRPRTYGNGARGYLKLVGADDLGMEVDDGGFVINLVCGHIR